MMYYAFGYVAGKGEGGLNDLLGQDENIETLKKQIEQAAPEEVDYWGEYDGVIAYVEFNDFHVKLFYAAKLTTNRVFAQLWSEGKTEINAFMGRIDAD